MPFTRTIAFALLPMLYPTVASAQIVLDAVDFGYYTDSLHNPNDQRYLAGYFTNGNETRSFFVFDIPSSVTGNIAAATLELSPWGGTSPDRNETLNIYQVSTDIASLTSGATPSTTFEDLGSGERYGFANARIEASSSFGLQDYDSVDVPLNPQALSALNSSPGMFAFGGSMGSLLKENKAEILFSTPLLIPASNNHAQLFLHPAGGPTGDYTTALHPLASQMSVELFLGNPEQGGVPIAALNDIGVQGTIQATAILDETNSGLLQVHGANLALEDVTDLVVDLDILGGITLDLTGTVIDLQFDPVEVINSSFSLDDQEFVHVAIVDGEGTLRNPTGPIASLFDEFPLAVDLEAEPIFATEDDIAGQGVGGTTDLGLGPFSDFRELNLDIPSIPFRVLVDGELEVWGRFSGNIHVAVPEPATHTLASLGFFLTLLVAKLRFAGGSSETSKCDIAR